MSQSKYNRLKLNVLIGAVALFSTAVSVAAPLQWTLTGATLVEPPGGPAALLTGSFLYDATANLYSGWNITTETQGDFLGATYTPLNSLATTQTPTSFGLFNTAVFRGLGLDFSQSLTGAGGVVGLSTTSSETLILGRQRFVAGGSVVAAAIPEPSTYALMLAGLGIVGFVAHRRRKAQTQDA